MSNGQDSDIRFVGRQSSSHYQPTTSLFASPQTGQYDGYSLKDFIYNLLKAARDIGIIITYLLIAVVLPVALGIISFFTGEHGPYCIECINIGGNFYPKYGFWSALFLCGGGLMLLLLGIRSLIKRLRMRSASRYHLIRAR